jgi:hypothetical protein
MTVDKCTICGKEIREFLTGRKAIDGKMYCRSCYYDEVGRMVEEHPIGTPRKATAAAQP